MRQTSYCMTTVSINSKTLYLKIQVHVWWLYISNCSKFFKQSDDKICARMFLITRTVLNYHILFVCDSPYDTYLNYMYLWTKLSLSAGKMEHFLKSIGGKLPELWTCMISSAFLRLSTSTFFNQKIKEEI